MTTTEDLSVFKERLGMSEKRLDKLEDVVKDMNSLTISVEKMSVTLAAMVEEMRQVSTRVSNIEMEPARSWKMVKNQIITVIITAIITYFITS